MKVSPPVYAVIVAGGQGTRMGTALPKQFLDLAGKPVLFYAIDAFLKAIPDISIVLVLPPAQLSYTQMILQHFPGRLDMQLVAGGPTRFHSVQNGLYAIPKEAIVFVHDGARPLLSPGLILRCYEQALEKGNAVPAIEVVDSIRKLTVDYSVPVDRRSLRIIQTPQTFHAGILMKAMQQPYNDTFTDEATVVEATGETIFLIEGDRLNIKITTPEDLIIAAALLQKKEL